MENVYLLTGKYVNYYESNKKPITKSQGYRVKGQGHKSNFVDLSLLVNIYGHKMAYCMASCSLPSDSELSDSELIGCNPHNHVEGDTENLPVYILQLNPNLHDHMQYVRRKSVTSVINYHSHIERLHTMKESL